MSRQLRAERYATGASPSLVSFIVERLPFLSFGEAMRFYEAATPKLLPTELALLGCNDRFYLFTALLNRVDGIHPWLYDRAREIEADPDGHLDLWSRFHYKMVDVNEPVPTPRGWRKHGDLTAGDEVFGPDGRPTKVLGRTMVYTDGACYRVSFDKGYSVVVGAEHLWTVNVSSKRRINGSNRRDGRKSVTVNTRDLAKYVAHSKRHSTVVLPSIPVCEPLQYPAADLPIAPYVLGCWLGDGTSSSGEITCGDDIWGEVEKTEALSRDMTPDRNAQRRRIVGLTARLRALGLLGAKGIPALYEFSSVEQRIGLLQGLMDTDGHCDARGTATFVNINEDLARGVFRLAAGLGLKPSIRHVNGIYEAQPYPYFQVSFQARAESFSVFRLDRKQARATAARPGRSSRHAIVEVELIDPQACSCIEVDREDGLYLIGEQCVTTHNSSLSTFAGAIQEALIDPETRICIFSNNKNTARPFLQQIKEELESNEALKATYADALYASPRVESPLWSLDNGLTIKRKGNFREATFEAHGVIDALPTGKHFPVLLYDDIITEKNVTNPEQIAKATERTELSFPIGIGEKTRRRMVGTRYHFADSYGQLIERGVAVPRLHPATEDGTLDGVPVFMTPEAWEAAKRDMRSTVAAQFLQNPIAGKENSFYSRWLRPYWVLPSVMNVYIMGDPSKGKSATSDRTAFAVVGIDTTGNKYLIDGYCHRMPLSERWLRLKELHRKWSAHPGVQRVSVGYERYGAQADDEYFAEKMREQKSVFEIVELNWTGQVGRESKKHRVERLEPDFRLGNFFVPARLWHPDIPQEAGNTAASVVWAVKEETGEFEYRPYPHTHREERRVLQAGERWRVLQPLRRKDEDGSLYDLVRVFFDEFTFFPFSPRDDFVDALSRIYDMSPMPATQFETLRVEDYVDGA